MFGIQFTVLLSVILIANLTGAISYIQNAALPKPAVLSAQAKPSPTPEPTPTPSPSASPSPTPTAKPTFKPSFKPSVAQIKPSPSSSVNPSPSSAPTGSSNTNNPTPTASVKLAILSSIEPSNPAFSAPMTLKGDGFGDQAGSIVVYDYKGEAQPAPLSTSWSNNEIKSYSPFYIADQEYSLEIWTADGRKSNRLAVKSGAGQPYIGEFSPSNAKPGDEITLKGGQFENNSGQVNFFLNYPNISGSGSIVSWSENEIKLKIPSNLEAGKEYGVQIINGRGGRSSFKYYTLGS